MKRGFTKLAGILVAVLFICGFQQEKPECKKLRNGKFIYHSKFGNTQLFYSITRKDTLQWEINQLTGDTSTYTIKWTGDCSYNLYFVKNSNHAINARRQATKNLPIRTEILSTNKNFYVFKGKQDNTAFTLIDTLWIKK